MCWSHSKTNGNLSFVKVKKAKSLIDITLGQISLSGKGSKISWCLWQSDILTNLIKCQKELSLPLAIHKVLIPIFKDLPNQDLQKKCLYGQTQNNNESLNGVIWKRCPKDIYFGKRSLKLSLNSAIISFNDGFQGVIKVFKVLGINTGRDSKTKKENQSIQLLQFLSKNFSNDNLLKDFNSGKLSQKDFVQYLGNPDDNCLTFATPNGYKSKQDKLKTGLCNFAQFMNTEKYSTSEILQYAYLSMDRDITLEAIPDGECIEPIWTGLSGSVAIGAYIKENDVFVASTGDCRGVLGVKSDQKLWLSIPLSEDHTADNINEVLRIKKQNPNEENTVILQSHLLGQLQPLRSFGDVIYKWSKELHRHQF
ncbi:uncharacterized protein LOC136093335 [Hydra vulgaris]|uniref:uncharacterized protein LOC136093335 n=1 Tax=Hydra vulgaris TaxID=6087 RepID=UPI0032EA3C09